MDYTVVKDFIERGTLKSVKAGEKYTCLADRAELLIKRGYLAAPEPEGNPEKAVAEKPKKEAKTAKAKAAPRSKKKA